MHIMKTQSFLNSGILQIEDIFDPVTMASLVAHTENTVMNFEQQYPKRLFSSSEHQNIWQGYFDSVLNSIFGTYSIQQIFLGYELPHSHFSYHKSHPNIGSVCVFNLDDFKPVNLRVMNTEDIELNYVGHAQFQQKAIAPNQYTDFDFQRNQLLVIQNRPTSRAWGFSNYIPENTVKRSIWIYLN